MQYRRHQWVEEVVVRLCTTDARFARAYDRYVLDPVNALQELFEQSPGPCRVLDSGKVSLVLMKVVQAPVKQPGTVTVPGPH